MQANNTLLYDLIFAEKRTSNGFCAIDPVFNYKLASHTKFYSYTIPPLPKKRGLTFVVHLSSNISKGFCLKELKRKYLNFLCLLLTLDLHFLCLV